MKYTHTHICIHMHVYVYHIDLHIYTHTYIHTIKENDKLLHDNNFMCLHKQQAKS